MHKFGFNLFSFIPFVCPLRNYGFRLYDYSAFCKYVLFLLLKGGSLSNYWICDLESILRYNFKFCYPESVLRYAFMNFDPTFLKFLISNLRSRMGDGEILGSPDLFFITCAVGGKYSAIQVMVTRAPSYELGKLKKRLSLCSRWNFNEKFAEFFAIFHSYYLD